MMASCRSHLRQVTYPIHLYTPSHQNPKKEAMEWTAAAAAADDEPEASSAPSPSSLSPPLPSPAPFPSSSSPARCCSLRC